MATSISTLGPFRSDSCSSVGRDAQRFLPFRSERLPNAVDGFSLLEASGDTKVPENVIKVSLATRDLKSIVCEDLACFRNLDTLDLSRNRLSNPDILLELGNLRRLRVLLLSCNGISNVHTEYSVGGEGSLERSHKDGKLRLLPHLEELDLSFNDLEGDAMLNLAKLTSLVKLSVSHNNIAAIPTQVGNFPNNFPFLIELDLSHNDLVQYDQWRALEGLPRLKALSLAYNRMRRVEPLVPMVKEEVGRRGTTDVFRSLKWLDLSGNELKDLKRLHESLAMLLGPRERTVVVRGNPPAERPDFPEWAKLLYDRVGPAKIRFITEVTEASISTATKAVRLIDPLPLRALRGQHGTRLVDKAKRLTEKKEKLVLQRTEGLLDPTLADEDVDTLLNARRRQIEEFVEDFESALSEMNGESSLTSVPFPLCESTQRNLNELLVKMDGETVEDSETEEVEDSCSASKEDCDDVDEHQGSILVKAEPPVLRVSSDESQSAPITQVDTAMAFITDKSSSDAPLRPKHREPTVSDVTGALGAMRMLREAESKYNETMLLCD